MTDFERISGLKCNIDKTCVMFIGPLDPVEAPQIEEMGFRIVNKIKILGFSVSREGIVKDDNFAFLDRQYQEINSSMDPVQLNPHWADLHLQDLSYLTAYLFRRGTHPY